MPKNYEDNIQDINTALDNLDNLLDTAKEGVKDTDVADLIEGTSTTYLETAKSLVNDIRLVLKHLNKVKDAAVDNKGKTPTGKNQYGEDTFE